MKCMCVYAGGEPANGGLQHRLTLYCKVSALSSARGPRWNEEP